MSTILIVDDDAMTLRMLDYTLTGGGHSVVSTERPEEAAALAAEHEVDAVILDILMPGRSGFEVLSELQANVATTRVPVLLLSSLSKSSDRVKGLREGAHEYIAKPFDPEELLLRLNRMLTAAPADSAAFQGRLSAVSFAEVAQSLLNGGKSGTLEVHSGGVRGVVHVMKGDLVGARFGRLESMDAMLTMLGLNDGSFRFSNETGATPPASSAEKISLQQAIFSAAWVEDELQRWPEVGTGTVIWPLAAGQPLPAIPEGYEVIPFAELMKNVIKKPGATVGDLVALEFASPRRTELAARILVQIGALRVVPSGDPRDGQCAQNTGGLARAAQAVLDAAERQNLANDLAYVLVLIDATVYATILQFRQAIPTDALAGKGDSLTVAWRSKRTAAVPVRAVSGQVVIHVAPCEPGPILDQVRARVTDYAGVVGWFDDVNAVDRVRIFVDLVETGPSGHWGLVIAGRSEVSDRAVEVLGDGQRWTVHRGEPTDLEELLELVAQAAPAC